MVMVVMMVTVEMMMVTEVVRVVMMMMMMVTVVVEVMVTVVAKVIVKMVGVNDEGGDDDSGGGADDDNGGGDNDGGDGDGGNDDGGDDDEDDDGGDDEGDGDDDSDDVGDDDDGDGVVVMMMTVVVVMRVVVEVMMMVMVMIMIVVVVVMTMMVVMIVMMMIHAHIGAFETQDVSFLSHDVILMTFFLDCRGFFFSVTPEREFCSASCNRVDQWRRSSTSRVTFLLKLRVSVQVSSTLGFSELNAAALSSPPSRTTSIMLECSAPLSPASQTILRSTEKPELLKHPTLVTCKNTLLKIWILMSQKSLSFFFLFYMLFHFFVFLL